MALVCWLRVSVYGVNTEAGEALTIGNVGDLAKDVVSADLFITLWRAHQRLADHGNIDFGTNTPVCGLKVKQKQNVNNPELPQISL